jgi:outer membrane usher protein FimD/PapC
VVVETCLTPEQVALLGLREDALKMIKWLDEGRCADFSALEGVVLRGDLSESSLQIVVPQAWLEYQDASWLPVSRWEEGIPGMLVDYNLNTNVTWPRQGNQSQSASISGTTGVNLGAWRLRGIIREAITTPPDAPIKIHVILTGVVSTPIARYLE